ncbi:hypothetical protein Ga0074812_112120 [Parafrankia irregularis]|uniref:Uncharacterized protein n=1 Tax=Parafrankia irregularis TaxID=795642 RepID=A0A0S4QQ61_9ACTN|nr:MULTISPECIES: hypothetical protein [Parafrankia]CUU57460.1 hypothetical protein Ga0074812_112120 [Parafrankia irregularis]
MRNGDSTDIDADDEWMWNNDDWFTPWPWLPGEFRWLDYPWAASSVAGLPDAALRGMAASGVGDDQDSVGGSTAETTPSTATAATRWEFDSGGLRALWPEPSDSLIVGLLPASIQSGGEAQEMLLCDLIRVDADVMVGASIGVAQLATVGLVVLHRRFTSLMQTRVAWAVGVRLRQARLAAGTLPRVVMAGSLPSDDMIPDGVTFSAHRVHLRDHGVISPVQVWEANFPPLVTDGENTVRQAPRGLT